MSERNELGAFSLVIALSLGLVCLVVLAGLFVFQRGRVLMRRQVAIEQTQLAEAMAEKAMAQQAMAEKAMAEKAMAEKAMAKQRGSEALVLQASQASTGTTQTLDSLLDPTADAQSTNVPTETITERNPALRNNVAGLLERLKAAETSLKQEQQARFMAEEVAKLARERADRIQTQLERVRKELAAEKSKTTTGQRELQPSAPAGN